MIQERMPLSRSELVHPRRQQRDSVDTAKEQVQIAAEDFYRVVDAGKIDDTFRNLTTNSEVIPRFRRFLLMHESQEHKMSTPAEIFGPAIACIISQLFLESLAKPNLPFDHCGIK